MYIHNLKINNYRGIVSEDLIFNKLNTLVGKNDSGKSTIINSLKLFFNDEKVSQKDFNFYSIENKDIIIEVKLRDIENDILKEFLVNGEKDDGYEEIIEDFIFDGDLVIKKVWEYKESGEISSKIYLGVNSFKDYEIYSAKTASLKKWGNELSANPPVEGSGNNSDLERMAYLRKKLLEDRVERDFIYILKKHNDIKTFLPTVELLKADQSIETTTSEFKGTFSTEIRSIIRNEKESGENSTLLGIETKISEKIMEESSIIKSCMSEHISDLSDLIIKPSFSWEKGVEITNVDIKLNGDKAPIPLENKGSGYRRLFMVGRLRYLADKKQSENVIYLVEEPETFLHPSAQQEMLDSLISLSESNQIFITTHSPIFVGSTKQDSIILCKKDNSELKYEQSKDDDYLFDIANDLGVKPNYNLLDTYEKIIFVEGSNDREFLRVASKKLGKDFHKLENENKLAIIDGGGGSLNNFVDISFFENHNKNMFLVIDSDIFDKDQITDLSQQKSLTAQQIKNKELKDKFELKRKAKCFILDKKNIDTYYHPKAIERHIGIDLGIGLFPNNYCTKTLLKQIKKENPKLNINAKNWLEIFDIMTEEEWREVSNGELEGIFDKILQY